MSETLRTTHDRIVYEGDHMDRIRWPAVIAGIFGTLSSLAVLTVLGTAIGLSAVDQSSDARNFATGAGIWGAISALLAFAFGGWLAARSSDSHARGHGILQSAMVWMVSIAMLTYLLGAGIGALATSAAQGATANPDLTSRTTANGASGTINYLDRGQMERAADRGARGAWIALIGMLLGLGASVAGGYMGSRRDDDDDHRRASVTVRPATTG